MQGLRPRPLWDPSERLAGDWSEMQEQVRAGKTALGIPSVSVELETGLDDITGEHAGLASQLCWQQVAGGHLCSFPKTAESTALTSTAVG